MPKIDYEKNKWCKRCHEKKPKLTVRCVDCGCVLRTKPRGAKKDRPKGIKKIQKTSISVPSVC